MEIAIGWVQAVKKVSDAVTSARPVGNAALLVLLVDVKLLPLWKFLRFSGSIATSKLKDEYCAGKWRLSDELKEIGMKICMVTTKFLLLLAALGAMVSVSAQSEVDLEDSDNQVGYSLGVNIGMNLLQQGITADVQVDAFIAGLSDALSDTVQMDEAAMTTAIQLFVQQQQEAAQSALADNLAASEAFLAENGQQDGVVTLPSGLQYRVLASGEGESPTTTDSVLAHYHGTLTDGTVFDSSVDRGEPATFGLSQVIAGWTEALQLMKVGDKWRLFIPPSLAYGEASPTPAIPPNSALIFDVELLEIR
ncbi:MAG: FKBP-type peptidyl-prolyl cis-trans isomerase [Pseudomonadota bacterium]|jgi:FKBP-type peptidyl-prolyl cis-trans isomerase FklB|nr:FKBP-type peptidyl-prolyl cis-trans isomerase [Pseudomonadota bacterium]